MGRLVLYMSVSPDGSIDGPGDDKDNPSGPGRRLSGGPGPGHFELHLSRTVESPGARHLRYQVRYA